MLEVIEVPVAVCIVAVVLAVIGALAVVVFVPKVWAAWRGRPSDGGVG